MIFSVLIIGVLITAGILFLPSDNEIKDINKENIEQSTLNSIQQKIQDKGYMDEIREKDSVESKKGYEKRYYGNDKRLEIKQGADVILDIELKSSYNVLVEPGEDVKVAEFYLNDYGSVNNLFDDINFYEKNKGFKSKEKSYWFKYGTDYIEEECRDLSEFEEIEEKLIYCQNVTKTNWTSFNNLKDLPNKNIKIGLFTDTRGEKKVEWIPNIKGFDVLEYASYEIFGVSTYNDIDGEYSIDSIQSLAVSPDGNYLFTSSYEDDYVSIMELYNDNPQVTINSPLNQTYTTNTINFNITATDDSGMGSCDYSIDSGATNYTMTNIGDNWNATQSNLIMDTSYIAEFYCIDADGNKNYTESVGFYVSDDVFPSVTNLNEHPKEPAGFSPSGEYLFNSTVIDSQSGVDMVLLEFNGTNYSTTKHGNVYSTTISNLKIGNYSYTWIANDSVGNINNTEIGSYRVYLETDYCDDIVGAFTNVTTFIAIIFLIVLVSFLLSVLGLGVMEGSLENMIANFIIISILIVSGVLIMSAFMGC